MWFARVTEAIAPLREKGRDVISVSHAIAGEITKANRREQEAQ